MSWHGLRSQTWRSVIFRSERRLDAFCEGAPVPRRHLMIAAWFVDPSGNYIGMLQFKDEDLG